MRPELSVPVSEAGKVLDDFRIQAFLPTLQFLLKNNCQPVIVSKLGRPKGKHVAKYSLKPVAERIAELLGLPFSIDIKENRDKESIVFLADDIFSEGLLEKIVKSSAKQIIVLENIRFYSEEEKGDVFLAKKISHFGDSYIAEAFGVAHRADTSIALVPKYLPSYAGLVMESEIKNLTAVINNPKNPFALLLGGVKVSDRTGIIHNLGSQVDHVMVGGALGSLFLKAAGYEVGLSLIEESGLAEATRLLREYKGKVMIPKDVVVQTNAGKVRAVSTYEVQKTDRIYDIGPKTILEYSKFLKKTKTLIWNGPMGLFEQKPFDAGTMALAKVVGGIGKGKSFVVCGGGETVEAIRKAGQQDHIDHLSTGGGAMLEFLAGNEMPGIKVLE